MSKLSIIKLYKENYDCIGSCLRTPSRDITEDEFGSKWLETFIFDMFETLYNSSSGVGIAANQVGLLKRICVVDIKRDGKSPIVLLNPAYSAVNDELINSREVCLSFPNVYSNVKRHKKVSVVYQNFYGEKCSLIAEGFKASVFQHEIDHLYGIVHVDLNQDDEINENLDYSAQVAKKAVETIVRRGECGNKR
ncbi:MAG: peptide deformylase [Muribaculaceae bacterium]|nr:peptide deformylase [Muribaculaceae bacterium]MCM1399879.1 peptide deformylase [Clostridium sp.]MCM1460635.1 peptide deformylase [Bacteroides sp.]